MGAAPPRALGRRRLPEGLAGEEIPLGARVIFVADAFDAMTSNRLYRQALTHEEALAEVERCSGTQFDPEVVAAFLAVDRRARARGRLTV